MAIFKVSSQLLKQSPEIIGLIGDKYGEVTLIGYSPLGYEQGTYSFHVYADGVLNEQIIDFTFKRDDKGNLLLI